MGLARTFIGFLSSGSNANSYAYTPSTTPTILRVQLVGVVNTLGGSQTPAIPSSVTGAGMTFELVKGDVTFLSGTVGVRMSVWRACGIPSIGNVTISFGGVTQTSCVAIHNEFDGVDGLDALATNGASAIKQAVGSTNGGSSHAGGTDFTTSISGMAGDERGVVFLTDMVNGSDWSALTGWTSLGGSFQGSPANNILNYWNSDAPVTSVGGRNTTTSNVGLIGVHLLPAASSPFVRRGFPRAQLVR